jgi:hypothetical protein
VLLVAYLSLIGRCVFAIAFAIYFISNQYLLYSFFVSASIALGGRSAACATAAIYFISNLLYSTLLFFVCYLRSGPQCCLRYRCTLDPRLKWRLWAPQEDDRLLSLREGAGYNWAMISAVLDRAGSTCRYRYLKLKKEEAEKEKEMEKEIEERVEEGMKAAVEKEMREEQRRAPGLTEREREDATEGEQRTEQRRTELVKRSALKRDELRSSAKASLAAAGTDRKREKKKEASESDSDGSGPSRVALGCDTSREALRRRMESDYFLVR